MRVPKKVADRFAREVNKYQKVLKSAIDRDVNESDTVTIITDILGSVFGFDKYAEVTGEQAIRGTYCDLAIKQDGAIKYLIEVKAVGIELKELHLRQAINYGANYGITWVVLTNGIRWEVYKIRFEKPVGCDLVASFNFLDLNPRKLDDQQKLFVLCKEGLSKAAIEAFHERVQAVNRFVIGALLTTEPVIEIVRRELRRLAPGLKITMDEIERILESDVLKRDVVVGEAATKAKSHVKKAVGKSIKKVKTPKGKGVKNSKEAQAVAANVAPSSEMDE